MANSNDISATFTRSVGAIYLPDSLEAKLNLISMKLNYCKLLGYMIRWNSPKKQIFKL